MLSKQMLEAVFYWFRTICHLVWGSKESCGFVGFVYPRGGANSGNLFVLPVLGLFIYFFLQHLTLRRPQLTISL